MELEPGGVRTPPLLNARFRDFDELSAAATGWDLDFLQLDTGRGPAALTQVSVPGILLQRFSFSRAYLQRGGSPSRMRTFGLLDPARCDGRSVHQHALSLDRVRKYGRTGDFP